MPRLSVYIAAIAAVPTAVFGISTQHEDHDDEQRKSHTIMRREKQHNLDTLVYAGVNESVWPSGQPCKDNNFAANAQLKADKKQETGCAGLKDNCEVAEWSEFIMTNCPFTCAKCEVGWTTRHGSQAQLNKSPAGWRLIASQNTTEAELLNKPMHFNYEVRSTLMENEDDPTAATYMIIGAYNSEDPGLKFFGGYHFALVWDGQINIRWTQTSWLNDTQITGFGCEHPLNCGPNVTAEGAQFKGLGRCGGADDLTVFDGNGEKDYWWNAVGTMKSFEGNKIPGWHQKHASTMQLYLAERRWNITLGCTAANSASNQVVWQHDKAAYGVCCTTDKSGQVLAHRQDKNGNCFNGNNMVSFFEANATCVQNGMSLCTTTAEAANNATTTCDSKDACGWNGKPVWAGVEVQPEFWAV